MNSYYDDDWEWGNLDDYLANCYPHYLDKIVKTRKPHTCEFCGHTIRAGDLAWFSKQKLPRFDYSKYEDGVQVGIEYMNLYLHLRGDEDCETERRKFIEEERKSILRERGLIINSDTSYKDPINDELPF